MNVTLLLHTICYLRPTQIAYQILYRLHKPFYKEVNFPKEISNKRLSIIPIPREYCFHKGKGVFCFLNLEDKFKGWNDATKGMLWAYNLNYMDWLNQCDIPTKEVIHWIKQFVTNLPKNRIGLDPYPIALRGINWMKFVLLYGNELERQTVKRWNDSLYSQYTLLGKKLEYHLMGNHLLEDAYSLYMASLYFEDKAFFKKASRLLIRELEEQVLPDGAHYEQSPMYHCILLDRLLDCYNFSISMECFAEQGSINGQLKKFVVQMLGHLESLVYEDRTIPLLNDSAYGIAPEPTKIFDYAKHLGIEWDSVPMKECGYRKMRNSRMEAIVDIGNVTATYQPGHTHADTFNYELRVNGKPFIVDTGISTYNKTERRQYERSTAAHNTVTINGCNSSEVWGGFRVGNRAKVTVLEDLDNQIKASHNGFGKAGVHARTFRMNVDGITIIDSVSSNNQAISYIHLASEVEVKDVTNKKIVTNCGMIHIHNAQSIEVVDEKASTTYNLFQPTKTIKILFFRELTYTILDNNHEGFIFDR